MPIISHLQDVKTDTTAIDVNVWVITRGVKLDRRRCHGVIWWEVNRNLELQPSVDLAHRGSERSIHHVTRRQDERRTYRACRTLDRSHPVKQIRVRPRERGLRVACMLTVGYSPVPANTHDSRRGRHLWYSLALRRITWTQFTTLTISVISSLLSLSTPRSQMVREQYTYITTHRFVTLPAGSPPVPATEGLVDARGARDEVICSISKVKCRRRLLGKRLGGS